MILPRWQGHVACIVQKLKVLDNPLSIQIHLKRRGVRRGLNNPQGGILVNRCLLHPERLWRGLLLGIEGGDDIGIGSRCGVYLWLRAFARLHFPHYFSLAEGLLHFGWRCQSLAKLQVSHTFCRRVHQATGIAAAEGIGLIQKQPLTREGLAQLPIITCGTGDELSETHQRAVKRGGPLRIYLGEERNAQCYFLLLSRRSGAPSNVAPATDKRFWWSAVAE